MQKYKPYEYQVYCENRIITDPFIALFLDMGLGKTVITLSAINRLRYDYLCIRRVLIIAPKKVAEATWFKEASKWEGLNKLRFSLVLGSAAQRVRALKKSADIYVINRDNVCWLVDFYRNDWPFDMVVLDESSSFKNHQAKRFKALKAVRPKIGRLIELTGTPAPHGLTDLWAQIYLLDGGKRLGRTISTYRDMYFVPDKRNRSTIFSYAPREGADEAIQDAISDICISLKLADCFSFESEKTNGADSEKPTIPDCIYEDIPVVLDAPALKAYKQMERDALLAVDDDTIITAGTAAVLTGKLLQLCNGAVYDEDGNVTHIHDCKVEAFMETLEQLNGQHVLVFYNFQHDRERLLVALQATKLHVRVYAGAQDEADWNAGKIDVLLAHPASCGYGLNLQGGGHHIIWFGLTWSLEQYLQANKRLHRQGQEYPVIVHHLVVVGGTDEDVMRSLTVKDKTQESLLMALKAKIKEAKESAL